MSLSILEPSLIEYFKKSLHFLSTDVSAIRSGVFACNACRLYVVFLFICLFLSEYSLMIDEAFKYN